MSVVQYAVLAPSLTEFQEVIIHKFNIPRTPYMDMGMNTKFTFFNGEVNRVYTFVGSMKDLSNIPGGDLT
jgi:hypothetical protein